MSDVAERQARGLWRNERIKQLQAELRDLLDEEARENCANLEGVRAECIEMVRRGKRTDAVKMYRNATGLSLLESMQVIDALVAR